MNRTLLESLDPRTLLSTVQVITFAQDGEIVPPAEGAVISLGGPNAQDRIASDYGLRHDVTVLVSYDWVIVTKDPARSGNFQLPTVKPDGSVALSGTTDADQISVERVTSNLDNINDKEFDVIVTFDDKGVLRSAPNSFDPKVNATQLAQLRQSLATQQSELEAAMDAGNAKRIAEAKKRVELSEKLIADREALQAKLGAGKLLRFSLAGVYDYYVEMPQNLTSAAKITIEAGAGADKVSLGSSVPIKASVFGGSGPDILSSGKKTANLYGGGGNDKLVSRSVKGGLLDGGAGNDQYINRGSAEVRVEARRGDSLVLSTTYVPVASPGLFGFQAVSNRLYYIVDSADGQYDLLKS